MSAGVGVLQPVGLTVERQGEHTATHRPLVEGGRSAEFGPELGSLQVSDHVFCQFYGIRRTYLALRDPGCIISGRNLRDIWELFTAVTAPSTYGAHCQGKLTTADVWLLTQPGVAQAVFDHKGEICVLARAFQTRRLPFLIRRQI